MAEKDNSILPVVIDSQRKPAVFVVGLGARQLWRELILSFCKICRSYRGIEDLARNFMDYINKSDVTVGDDGIGGTQGELLLCGYEEEDIFPSVVRFGVDCSDGMSLKILEEQKVTFKKPVVFTTLGDMNIVSPVLSGVSQGIYESCIKFCERHDEFSNPDCFKEQLLHLDSTYHKSLVDGIETFDIQDMIDAAETLLNTNMRLRKLETGKETEVSPVKEIAVLTKTEGLTWIKHSIFAV